MGSWKEFGVVPCLKLVSVLTSVRSFVTSAVLVEHTVRECTRLAVGSQVEGIAGGPPMYSHLLHLGVHVRSILHGHGAGVICCGP
jgi:hypothetical protein